MLTKPVKKLEPAIITAVDLLQTRQYLVNYFAILQQKINKIPSRLHRFFSKQQDLDAQGLIKNYSLHLNDMFGAQFGESLPMATTITALQQQLRYVKDQIVGLYPTSVVQAQSQLTTEPTIVEQQNPKDEHPTLKNRHHLVLDSLFNRQKITKAENIQTPAKSWWQKVTATISSWFSHSRSKTAIAVAPTPTITITDVDDAAPSRSRSNSSTAAVLQVAPPISIGISSPARFASLANIRSHEDGLDLILFSEKGKPKQVVTVDPIRQETSLDHYHPDVFQSSSRSFGFSAG